MGWEKIAINTWEKSSSNNFDFVITKENRKFIMDIFNKNIEDNSESYIESVEFGSLKDAKFDAVNYI